MWHLSLNYSVQAKSVPSTSRTADVFAATSSELADKDGYVIEETAGFPGRRLLDRGRVRCHQLTHCQPELSFVLIKIG